MKVLKVSRYWLKDNGMVVPLITSITEKNPEMNLNFMTQIQKLTIVSLLSSNRCSHLHVFINYV